MKHKLSISEVEQNQESGFNISKFRKKIPLFLGAGFYY